MKKKLLFIVSCLMMFAITGCGHQHTFSDATCTDPAKCTECGEVQGEALGHTTEVGMCERCNQYQGIEIVESVLDYVSKGNASAHAAIQLISYGTASTYEGLYKEECQGVDKFKEACENYNAAIDLCKDYSGLATLKRRLEAAVNEVIDKPKSTSTTDMDNFSESYSLYLTKLEDVERESAAITKDINYSIVSIF